VLETIVVGYDGSRPAERALERAAELALAFGARVVIADVIAPATLTAAPGAFGLVPYYPESPDDAVRIDDTIWRQHRERIGALLGASGIRYDFAGVIGQPAKEIVDVADKEWADLIVLGTRQAGLLERILDPSVSADVSRHAHCDVLIVQPPPEPGED